MTCACSAQSSSRRTRGPPRTPSAPRSAATQMDADWAEEAEVADLKASGGCEGGRYNAWGSWGGAGEGAAWRWRRG
eukprot:2305411-Rhodomonas_salina.2